MFLNFELNSVVVIWLNFFFFCYYSIVRLLDFLVLFNEINEILLEPILIIIHWKKLQGTKELFNSLNFHTPQCFDFI